MNNLKYSVILVSYILKFWRGGCSQAGGTVMQYDLQAALRSLQVFVC